MFGLHVQRDNAGTTKWLNPAPEILRIGEAFDFANQFGFDSLAFERWHKRRLVHSLSSSALPASSSASHCFSKRCRMRLKSFEKLFARHNVIVTNSFAVGNLPLKGPYGEHE